MTDKDLAKLLSKAIDDLPPQCQRIYRLVKEEGLCHNAIAKELELSPNTVKNQNGVGIAIHTQESSRPYHTGMKYLGILSAILLMGWNMVRMFTQPALS